MPARTIYKLLTRSEWEDAQAAGVYRGSSHDWRDGFIHFSTAAQLGETARKYFTGEPDLVLLAVDVGALAKTPSLCLSPRGREDLEIPSARIQASLLPGRIRKRMRQQKMQARQGVLARRRTG